MRRSLLVLTASLLVASAAATQLPLPGPSKNSTSKPMSDPSFPQPGSIPAADRLLGSSNSEMSLADALTLERKAGVWWDYARDVSSVTARLHALGLIRTTLLVPVDSAIMRLPRKPHQNKDGEPETDESAKKNVEAFLSAHIIPGSVELPCGGGVETLAGTTVEIVEDEEKEGGWRAKPGDIEVLGVKDASNGRILYLDGVVPY